MLRVSACLLSLVLLPGCGSTPRASQSTADLTHAQALALLDDVQVSDSRVARYVSLLQRLDAAHVENERQIADMTVAARQLLKKEGISETNLRIMDAVDRLAKAVPPGVGDLEYARNAVLYVQQRRAGKSHEKAVDTLLQIVSAIGAPK